MANTRLILRSVNSDFQSPFQDTVLGSVLNHEDLDNNQIYLKGEQIYTGSTIGTELTLNKINGTTINIDLNALVSSTDNFTTGGTIINDVIYFDRSDQLSAYTVSISGISASISAATPTYTNQIITPTTIGGISAGSTFSGKTMQEMWDSLLYPYQPPVMSITSPLFKTYEFGESLPFGLQIVNYSVTHPSNIKQQPPNIGVPSSNIAGSTFPLNPFELLSTGTFQINIPLGFTYINSGSITKTNTITIQGTNTQNNIFSKSATLIWKHKRYWGSHPSFSLPSNSEILTANGASVGSGSEFSTSRVQSRNGINGGGGYLFFAWPSTFGTPTFTINGLPNTAWTKIGPNISFTNSNGQVEPYDVWISNTAQNSPITLFSIS